MTNQNENQSQQIMPVAVHDDGEFAIYADTAKFMHFHQVASMFSNANLVPKSYQGSLPDCFIAISAAMRMGVDPLQFMQKTYVVHGKLGIESQLAIALMNKSGLFVGPIKYEYTGKNDAYQCRAWAISASDDSVCEEICSVQEAKDMGWWTKRDSPWPKQTRKMLAYRSAINLIRKYHPEVLFGMDIKEDLIDEQSPKATPQPPKDITDEVEETVEEVKKEKPVKSTLNLKDMKSEDVPDNKPSEARELAAELGAMAKSDKYKMLVVKALKEGLIPNGGTLTKIFKNPKDSDVENLKKYIKIVKDMAEESAAPVDMVDDWKADLDEIVQELDDISLNPKYAKALAEIYKDGLTNAEEIKNIVENNDAVRAEVLVGEIKNLV